MSDIVEEINEILDEVRMEFHGDWGYDHFPDGAAETMKNARDEILRLRRWLILFRDNDGVYQHQIEAALRGDAPPEESGL